MKRLRESILLVLVACIAGHAGAARAADASAWADDASSSVRLIAGDAATAGVEIKLQPGWKTYWRYPGDSGVPPRFDFSSSENLANATVSFPVPHLFKDETGNSLGYKERVIFPVRVTAQDKTKPVTLKLKLEYAVCERLCIPAEGRAELKLPAGAGEFAAALKEAEARVPRKVEAAAIGFTAKRAEAGGKPSVLVEFAKASAKTELFVEGPTAEWALPIPARAAGTANKFTFELDGLPPGGDAKKAADLTFTIVDGETAYEVKTHLDEKR